MNNEISLIDISNACANNTSVSEIIKKLKLQNYDILISHTGIMENNKIRTILRFNDIMLTAYINIKNNMCIGRACNYKVTDGWQLKILR